MKNKWTIIPWKQLNKVASVLTFGATKHPGKKLGNKGDEAEYLDAALRHIVEHLAGVTEDHETKEPPLAHAVADLLIAMELRQPAEEITPDEILPHDVYGPITELPDWAEWVAVDKIGDVYIYELEPYAGEDVWWWQEGSLEEIINVVGPPADWTQTKRRIKR